MTNEPQGSESRRSVSFLRWAGRSGDAPAGGRKLRRARPAGTHTVRPTVGPSDDLGGTTVVCQARRTGVYVLRAILDVLLLGGGAVLLGVCLAKAENQTVRNESLQAAYTAADIDRNTLVFALEHVRESEFRLTAENFSMGLELVGLKNDLQTQKSVVAFQDELLKLRPPELPKGEEFPDPDLIDAEMQRAALRDHEDPPTEEDPREEVVALPTWNP